MSEREHGLQGEVSFGVSCEGEGDRLGEGRVVVAQERGELAQGYHKIIEDLVLFIMSSNN